ncbi:hypothetical protein [Methylomonas sp. MgM2]
MSIKTVSPMQPDARQQALYEAITQKGVNFLHHFGTIGHEIARNSLSDDTLISLQSACADMARLVAQMRQQLKTEAVKPVQTKPATIYLVNGAGSAENRPKSMTLAGYMKRQSDELGLTPMPLDTDLLLSRIRQGGDSGRFLADAFRSAYRKGVPFKHALFELVNLDTEAFRLFHQVLHIRHVPGWDDDALYAIEQQIKAITDGQS